MEQDAVPDPIDSDAGLNNTRRPSDSAAIQEEEVVALVTPMEEDTPGASTDQAGDEADVQNSDEAETTSFGMQAADQLLKAHGFHDRVFNDGQFKKAVVLATTKAIELRSSLDLTRATQGQIFVELNTTRHVKELHSSLMSTKDRNKVQGDLLKSHPLYKHIGATIISINIKSDTINQEYHSEFVNALKDADVINGYDASCTICLQKPQTDPSDSSNGAKKGDKKRTHTPIIKRAKSKKGVNFLTPKKVIRKITCSPIKKLNGKRTGSKGDKKRAGQTRNGRGSHLQTLGGTATKLHGGKVLNRPDVLAHIVKIVNNGLGSSSSSGTAFAG